LVPAGHLDQDCDNVPVEAGNELRARFRVSADALFNEIGHSPHEKNFGGNSITEFK
jgi:hypothetical protein